MPDTTNADKHYPPRATPEWVDKVVGSVKFFFVKGVEYKLEYAPKIAKNQLAALQDEEIIDRMIRGFIVEFLRQSRDEIEDINTAFERGDKQWATMEGRMGKKHIEACVRKMKECGLDKKEILESLNFIIRLSVKTFFSKHTELQDADTPFMAYSSILKDYRSLNKFIDELFTDTPSLPPSGSTGRG